MTGARKLYPHQKDGVQFLRARRVALLADEMGLGKTAQAVQAANEIAASGALAKCLIVIPQYLGSNWGKEIEALEPRASYIIVRGSRADRERAWSSSWPRFFIAGYETVVSDFDILRDRHWDLLILDEVQRLKNQRTSGHQIIQQIQSFRRWGLTGTPVENSFDDLTSIFAVLSPAQITREFLGHPENARKTLLNDVLRRYLRNVIVLPELRQKTILLDLTLPQREIYELVKKRGAASSLTAEGVQFRSGRKELRDAGGLTTQSALLRIASFHPTKDSSSKLDYLITFLSEMPPTEKAIVFSAFPNKVLRRISPHLSSYEPILIDGAQSVHERDQAIDLFQRNDSTRVALVSLKAGGVGLNLTRASRVVHFDSWWTASSKQQANSRAHRIGQVKDVLALSLVAADTIEEQLLRLLHQKAELARVVLGESSVPDIEIEEQLLKDD